MSIAQVHPTILLPYECLDLLKGVWLDLVGERSHRVSPLLKDAGKLNLPSQLQVRIHRAYADYYLSQQPISASDAFPIAIHLLHSGNHEDFVGFLAHFMLSIDTPARAEYFGWVYNLFSPELGWKPLDLSLSSKIIFRSLQVRILVLAEKPFEEYYEDLDYLMKQATSEEAFAIFAAYGSLYTCSTNTRTLSPLILH